MMTNLPWCLWLAYQHFLLAFVPSLLILTTLWLGWLRARRKGRTFAVSPGVAFFICLSLALVVHVLEDYLLGWF
jgi:hypothetical protein